jgi:hypothetical protein
MPLPSVTLSSRSRVCAWAMRLPGGTLRVSQTLPPMVEPRPIVTRPRMVAHHAERDRRIFDQLHAAGRLQERAAARFRYRRLAAQLDVAVLEHRKHLFPVVDGAR